MLSARLSTQFTFLFIFVCLHRFAAGGCLNYGHSCWGGHGKRSGNGYAPSGGVSQPRSTEWYIARLLRTQRDLADGKNIFGPENVVRGPGYDVLHYLDSQNKKQRIPGDIEQAESDDWSQDVNDSDPEVVVVDPDVQASPKIRLYQLLNEEGLRKHSIG